MLCRVLMMCVERVERQQVGDADTNLDNTILDGCGGVEDDDEDLELQHPQLQSLLLPSGSQVETGFELNPPNIRFRCVRALTLPRLTASAPRRVIQRGPRSNRQPANERVM